LSPNVSGSDAIKKEKIAKRLADHSTILELFTKEWFDKLMDDKQVHPLANLLLKDPPDQEKLEELSERAEKASDHERIFIKFCIHRKFYHIGMLTHLEKCLKTLEKESNINKTIEHLKNSTQFWGTLSELEVAASIKNNGFAVELEPSFSLGKFPDLKVNIDERDIFIEIVTPEIASELQLTSDVVIVPNNAWRTMITEFDQHFSKEISNGNYPKNSPIVITINDSFSEIDEIDIEDSFEGSLTLKIVKDRVKGNVVGTYPVRKEDSLPDIYADTNWISAAICYGRVHKEEICLRGTLIKNDTAKGPLSKKEIDKLKLFVNTCN